MFIERIINRKQTGFTMIELVIVMVLAGILSVGISVFIARPISAYASTVNRASLVDAADMTLRRMARDIQRAVPNSLRVKTSGSRTAVEMVNIVEGMRYRATPPTSPAPAGPYLDFTQPITNFHVIGQFKYAANLPACSNGSCRVVVYNTGANTGGAIPSDNPAPGQNVYSTVAVPACGGGCNPPPGSVTITPVSTSVLFTNPGSEGNIFMSAGTQFALPSPRQRIDIVDTPITYICDTSANQQNITRYANYTITPVQPTDPTVAPLNAATAAQLTNNVTACSFSYNVGTAQRNGVITMSITVINNGESITLMRQVGVDNTP